MATHYNTGPPPSSGGGILGKIGGAVGGVVKGAWDWLGRAIGSHGDAIGTGVANIYGQQQTNAANAKQAREQMDFQERMIARQEGFQERMSSTAVQRHVADLRAAGLNPALAFSSAGASSPAGAAAAGAQAHMEDAISGGVSSALASKQAKATMDATRAQALEVQRQTQFGYQTQEDEKRRIAAEAASAEQANRTSAALEESYKAQTDATRTGTALQRLQIPRAQAEAGMWSSEIGGTILPWAQSAAQLFRGFR